MKVTILGCGGSAGVPLIGCDCTICTSTNSKNKRLRASILIESNNTNILIDASPDLRQQALKHNIRRIDAVLITHDHADHIHGIDDLRSFNYLSGEALPVYSDETTINSLKQRFPYVMLPKPENIWFRPSLIPHIIPSNTQIKIHNLQITCFLQHHGKVNTLGFRFGDFAYSTDVDQLPEEAFEVLNGVDTWVVDCLRYSESYSHSNLKRTLGWIERVKPRLAILTHMAHDFDYDRLSAELPPGVIPAYDGMILECNA